MINTYEINKKLTFNIYCKLFDFIDLNEMLSLRIICKIWN